MKPNSIVYTSNTGFTQEYALLLGDKTGLPVYSLEEAGKSLAQGNTIIYLGWLMAGKVMGYDKVISRYHVAAVCAVGTTGSQQEDVRKNNTISGDTPVFTLQGGFNLGKLRGIYKLMMTVMSKTVGKKLAKKPDRTAEEEDYLDLMLHGGNRVKGEYLEPVVTWFREVE